MHPSTDPSCRDLIVPGGSTSWSASLKRAWQNLASTAAAWVGQEQVLRVQCPLADMLYGADAELQVSRNSVCARCRGRKRLVLVSETATAPHARRLRTEPSQNNGNVDDYDDDKHRHKDGADEAMVLHAVQLCSAELPRSGLIALDDDDDDADDESEAHGRGRARGHAATRIVTSRHTCDACQGTGMVSEVFTTTVRVPRCCAEGAEIVVPGVGSHIGVSPEAERNDVVVVVRARAPVLHEEEYVRVGRCAVWRVLWLGAEDVTGGADLFVPITWVDGQRLVLTVAPSVRVRHGDVGVADVDGLRCFVSIKVDITAGRLCATGVGQLPASHQGARLVSVQTPADEELPVVGAQPLGALDKVMTYAPEQRLVATREQ